MLFIYWSRIWRPVQAGQSRERQLLKKTLRLGPVFLILLASIGNTVIVYRVVHDSLDMKIDGSSFYGLVDNKDLIPHLELSGQTLLASAPSDTIIQQYLMRGMTEQDAYIDFSKGPDLRGRSLRNANFNYSKLYNANFENASLQSANLFEANLQGANVRGAQLQGADLRIANLQGAHLRQAALQGAQLALAELQGADLSSAELQGADLSSAKLQGTSLANAMLQGVDLSSAIINGAYMEGAAIKCMDVTRIERYGMYAKSFSSDPSKGDIDNVVQDIQNLNPVQTKGSFHERMEKAKERFSNCPQTLPLKPQADSNRFLDMRAELACSDLNVGIRIVRQDIILGDNKKVAKETIWRMEKKCPEKNG